MIFHHADGIPLAVEEDVKYMQNLGTVRMDELGL
ncbi:hypothetical protein BFJ66_g17323 [Fusarium oxysporum f. sp. cepae]|uniref:Uncharacterized protein n=1 Tax=Fusarium oxysporum f. sp. cepae TaxID=396571 RepID=A0A3L6N1Q2_FUSOX|nr:hypothetical protein BFJ65_g14730 [Fusarium oxysporum f. sp. cepae]RKK21569.1 hypothetical protein BFJ67_g17201 [Fusarium oxysporum f. sp. cepae]RKK23882.1 hypothetical protein BFJ66_g17323 [Fusarium oxysporum f. sp. cepae]